jgi:dGTPase
LHIVTALERRYPAFDGLNLTWEMLEGLVKHNGPLTNRAGVPIGRYKERGVPADIVAYTRIQDLELWSFAGAEAQIAAISDDIAYDAHDIDDGLRASLFGLDDIAGVALPGRIVGEIGRDYPALDSGRRVHEFIRRLIGHLIEDVIAETGRRIAALDPSSADAVRQASSPLAGFSAPVAEAEGAIKEFLKTRMYRHARVQRVMNEAAGVVRDLFARYQAKLADLPPEWGGGLSGLDEASRARRIADFIAGMTDRYALAEHARLFDSTPELR